MVENFEIGKKYKYVGEMKVEITHFHKMVKTKGI